MAGDKKEGKKGFFAGFFKKAERIEDQRVARDFLKDITIGSPNDLTIREKHAWIEDKLDVIRVMLGTAKEDVKTKFKPYDMLQLNEETLSLLKKEKADLKLMKQELQALLYDFQGRRAEQDPTPRRVVEEITQEIAEGPSEHEKNPVDWYKKAFEDLNEAYHDQYFIKTSSYFDKSFAQAQITVTTQISNLMKAEQGNVQHVRSPADENKEPSEETKGPQSSM